MTKKKTKWKTPATIQLNASVVEQIQLDLERLASKTFSDHPDVLTDLVDDLDDLLARIEKQKNPEDIIQLIPKLISTTMRVQGSFDDPFFNEFCDDASEVFWETAQEQYSEEEMLPILKQIILQLESSEGFEMFIFGADALLSKESLELLCEELLQVAEKASQEILWKGVLEVLADSTQNPKLYERAILVQMPSPQNAQFLMIADAYLAQDQVDTAIEWIQKVKDPNDVDRENWLDIQVSVLMKQGKKAEGLQMARTLYDQYTTEFNLARLCAFLPPEEQESLLSSFIASKGPGLHVDYAHLLLTIERLDLAESYICSQSSAADPEDLDDLEELAERLESLELSQPALCVRKILDAILDVFD